MQVINAYFALLSWQDYRIDRPGGKAYIENTPSIPELVVV